MALNTLTLCSHTIHLQNFVIFPTDFLCPTHNSLFLSPLALWVCFWFAYSQHTTRRGNPPFLHSGF